jgi:hypothetical protein
MIVRRTGDTQNAPRRVVADHASASGRDDESDHEQGASEPVPLGT